MLMGFLLILNTWVLWAVILPFYAVFYVLTVISEESFLRRRIGEEWEEYRRSVPALIPMPWKVKAENIPAGAKLCFPKRPNLKPSYQPLFFLC